MHDQTDHDLLIYTGLANAAWEARKNAYAPYSNYKVGAAVKISIDDINTFVYRGSNVENSSFGGTVCAERVAIFNAISHHNREGHIQIMELCFATDTPGKHMPPCGICMQIISEFARPETTIIHYNGKSIETWEWRELFSRDNSLKERLQHRT